MKLQDYSNKSVSFNFNKNSLQFNLSQQLFSSFDIDPGSKLLLKFCAEYIKQHTVKTILDIGCGVGTIGLSLAAALPEAVCTLQDRDALAVEFSRINAKKNGLSDRCRFAARPVFMSFPEKYDLVVSNIPAKAGNSVIESWISNLPFVLNPGGCAALVIVRTLAELLRAALLVNSFIIDSEFMNPNYAVFICSFSGKQRPLPDALKLPDFYYRLVTDFRFNDTEYRLRTAWNLPDFDTIGYDLSCAFRCIKDKVFQGDALFVHSRQGHLPAWLFKSGKLSGKAVIVDNDSLAIEVSASNIEDYCKPEKMICPAPFEALSDLMAELNNNLGLTAIRIPDNTPPQNIPALADILVSSVNAFSFVLIYGKTRSVNLLQQKMKKFVITCQHKNSGFRSVLLKKQTK